MDLNLQDGRAWAQSCTDELVRCVNLGASRGAAEWARARSVVPDDKHIRLWNTDLSHHDLSRFDFSRCKLKNIKLVGSNLTGASFYQAIARQCDFSRSILFGASFHYADMKTSIFRHVQVDNDTDFNFNKGNLPDDADLLLKDRAENAWAREELEQDASRGIVSRHITRAIGYGQSPSRLLALAFVAIMLFAAIFWLGGPQDITPFKAIVYSLKYFVALTDPFEETNFALSAVGTIEASVGLIFLALLLSAVTRKLVLSR